MGLFNPRLQETGGTNVTPKAAPQKPNIVGEVAKVVQASSSIFQAVGAARQEGVNNSTVAQFNQELTRISEGVNQGTISSQAAATAARTKYSQFVSQHPALTSEFNKAYKGVNETTDAFNVKDSEAEQIRKKSIDLATTQGFVQADMTEEQIDTGLTDFANWKLAGNKLSTLKSNQEYNNAKTNEERKVATEQRKVTSDTATQGYVDSRGGALKTSLTSTYSQVQEGSLSPSDGLIELQGLISNFRLEVTNSGTESLELANSLIKPYEEMADTFQKMIESPADAPYFESKNKVLISKQKSIVLSDPENAKAIAISNLTGNTVAGLLPMNKAVSRMFGSSLTKGTTGNGKTPIVVGESAGDDYIDVIKKSTKVLKAKGTPEDMQPAISELGIHVGQVLKSIDVYATAVERPEEYNKVVDFIASPEYASIVNAGLVDTEAAQNAQLVLQQDYADVLMPLIQDKVKTVFATRTGLIQGFGDTEVPIEEAVDIEVNSSGAIVFRPKEGLSIEIKRQGQYVRMIQELNTSVAKQMNKLVRMDAHLSGSTDYKAIAEQALPTLLGNQVEGEDKFGVKK